MKRTGPPARRTPLARSDRLRPVSARRRKRDAPYPAARQAVREREEGCCQRCRIYLLPDIGEVHHIAGRGGHDPHRLSNLALLCPACHRWVHANPKAAREAGLMRTRLGRTA